jgi:hypothetical protein
MRAGMNRRSRTAGSPFWDVPTLALVDTGCRVRDGAAVAYAALALRILAQRRNAVSTSALPLTDTPCGTARSTASRLAYWRRKRTSRRRRLRPASGNDGARARASARGLLGFFVLGVGAGALLAHWAEPGVIGACRRQAAARRAHGRVSNGRDGCATRHKLGIQRRGDRASRQIATLSDRAAWFERSMGTAAALGFGSTWGIAVLGRNSPTREAALFGSRL